MVVLSSFGVTPSPPFSFLLRSTSVYLSYYCPFTTRSHVVGTVLAGNRRAVHRRRVHQEPERAPTLVSLVGVHCFLPCESVVCSSFPAIRLSLPQQACAHSHVRTFSSCPGCGLALLSGWLAISSLTMLSRCSRERVNNDHPPSLSTCVLPRIR